MSQEKLFATSIYKRYQHIL